MATEFRRSDRVRCRRNNFGRFAAGGFDAVGRKAALLQHLLGGTQPHRPPPDAPRHEARAGAPAGISLEHGGYAHNGEIAFAARVLLDRETGARMHRGDPDSGEHFRRR